MTKKIFLLSILAFVGLTTFASPRSAKQAQNVAEDSFRNTLTEVNQNAS